MAELEELVVFGENMRQPGEEADMDSYNTWVLPVLLAGLKLLRPQHNDVQVSFCGLFGRWMHKAIGPSGGQSRTCGALPGAC